MNKDQKRAKAIVVVSEKDAAKLVAKAPQKLQVYVETELGNKVMLCGESFESTSSSAYFAKQDAATMLENTVKHFKNQYQKIQKSEKVPDAVRADAYNMSKAKFGVRITPIIEALDI